MINSYSCNYQSTTITGGSKLLQRKNTWLRFVGKLGSLCTWTMAFSKSLLSIWPNYLILSLYFSTLFPTHMELAAYPYHSVTHNKVNMEADTAFLQRKSQMEKPKKWFQGRKKYLTLKSCRKMSLYLTIKRPLVTLISVILGTW